MLIKPTDLYYILVLAYAIRADSIAGLQKKVGLVETGNGGYKDGTTSSPPEF